MASLGHNELSPRFAPSLPSTSLIIPQKYFHHLCGPELALPCRDPLLKRLLVRRERHTLRHNDVIIQQLRDVLWSLQDEGTSVLIWQDLKLDWGPLILHFVQSLTQTKTRLVTNYIWHSKTWTSFSKAFSSNESKTVFCWRFYWSLIQRVQQTKHWFRKWLNVSLAPSHYMNCCWPCSFKYVYMYSRVPL